MPRRAPHEYRLRSPNSWVVPPLDPCLLAAPALSAGWSTQSSTQLEQRPRIVAPDLLAVDFRDRRRIKPVGCMVDVLERPVGRKQDPIRADFQHRINQGLG